MAIEGILFDSGDTLVYPKTGSWWPGPEFYPILRLNGIEIETVNLDTALAAGKIFLSENHHVVDVAEEKIQFREFYRIVCSILKISFTDSLLESLTDAYVDQCNFALYPDTVPALNILAGKHISLGIVSDAWPSLHFKYINLGIRHYFSSFTISSQVGCSKPDERIYREAVRAIGINPEKLLFVDDDVDNVNAAIGLGMHGIIISRNGMLNTNQLQSALELRDIIQYVENNQI